MLSSSSEVIQHKDVCVGPHNAKGDLWRAANGSSTEERDLFLPVEGGGESIRSSRPPQSGEYSSMEEAKKSSQHFTQVT